MRPRRGKTFCCVFFANLPWAQNHESGAALAGKFVPFFCPFPLPQCMASWAVTRRFARKGGGRPPAGPSLGRNAIGVTAWTDSGMAGRKVSYGPDAPKLTPDFGPLSSCHA
jgi:hypothetical protein